MAVQNVRHIAPFINVVFTVTSEWWVIRWGELHRGLDIATGHNDPVYSMLNGYVVDKGYTSTAGNYIIIADDNPGSETFGYATRYLHFDDPSPLNINDRVLAGQQVGIEGSTGEGVTGIHLHVEMQNIKLWAWHWHFSNVKSDYLDPTIFMGIDNIEGTQWYYDGVPIPPTTVAKRKPFPWYIAIKKKAQKRLLINY